MPPAATECNPGFAKTWTVQVVAPQFTRIHEIKCLMSSLCLHACPVRLQDSQTNSDPLACESSCHMLMFTPHALTGHLSPSTKYPQNTLYEHTLI